MKKCRKKKEFALKGAIFWLIIVARKRMAPGTVKQVLTTVKNIVGANHKKQNIQNIGEHPGFHNNYGVRSKVFDNSLLAKTLLRNKGRLMESSGLSSF
ncbi:MAG: hypothetical protein ACE5HX_18340 [bacterium]